MLDALRIHAPNNEEARKCLGYVVNNQHRMRYPLFRAQGLCVSEAGRRRVTSLYSLSRVGTMRKLRTDGQRIDVDDRLPALRVALRDVPGLVACYQFGSYGSEWQTPLSDVDLGLVFELRVREPTFYEELDLVGMMTETLEEDDVSVTIVNKAPLAFRFDVLSKGRPLFVFDELGLADFVEETIDRHGDFAVDRDRFAAEYDRALAEDYGHGTR